MAIAVARLADTARGVAALTVAMLALCTRPLDAQKLQFRYITPDDGLAASWVQAIQRDRRGFMWFGTVRGLNRYDGHTLRTYAYDPADSTSLGGDLVGALHLDPKGELWVATDSGVSRYDAARDAFVNYDLRRPGGARADALSLTDDGRGTIWVGTQRGPWTVNAATGQVKQVAGALSTVSISAAIRARDGALWFGSDAQGLFKVDPKTGVTRHFTRDPARGNLPGVDLRDIAQDSLGNLWLAFYDAGLTRFDPRTGQVTGRWTHDAANPRSITSNVLVSVSVSPSGKGLWIGVENGGVDHLDFASGVFTHNPADPSNETALNHGSVYVAREDENGTLWVATFNGGVNISRPNSEGIQRFRAMPGDRTSLGGNSVTNFTEDAQGVIWVAADGGGLNRLDRATGRFRRYTSATSNLASDAVLDIAAERDGTLWVASWGGGVSRFDPSSERFTRVATGVTADNFFSLRIDRGGTLWAGSYRDGLLKYDRSTGRFTTIPIAPANGNEVAIRDIAETQAGELLVSTAGNGLVIVDPRTMQRTRYGTTGATAMRLASNQVHMATETQPGVVWVATSGGLDRIDRTTNRVTHFTTRDGLPSNTVSGFAADGSGSLWVTTDRGIVRFTPSTKTYKRYTIGDGLQGSEFLPGAAYAARDGALYFGGTKGFNVIRPAKITENRRPPRVALTGLQLFNRPVVIGAEGSPLEQSITETEELELTHKQSVFTLEFAALDFTAPDKNAFAYKLEGFDEEWNEVGRQRTASYTNLPPGRYVFRLRAANNDGVWNQTGLSLPIVVRPPFWATWWFRTIAIALLAWGVWSLTAAARRRRQHLEAMNAQLAQASEHDRELQQYLERNAEEILAAMERFSDGDLTVSLPVASTDVIGRLRGGVNAAIENIRAMVVSVQEVLEATASASQEIHASTEELAAGADEQIHQTAQVAVVATQMAASVTENATYVAAAAELAQQSGAEAGAGARVVRESLAGMEALAEAIGRSSETVEQLGQASAQIASITRVIERVADQASLLAFNGSIEAARAGAAGAGFAVVATEMRALAESTASATEEIRRLIQCNQRDVNAAVGAMREASTRLDADRKLAHQATGALDAIIANSERALESIRQVHASSAAQATSTADISENVLLISQVTQASASGTQQIAKSIEQLNADIAMLQAQVERFRLEQVVVEPV